MLSARLVIFEALLACIAVAEEPPDDGADTSELGNWFSRFFVQS
jgi:hypothetical protein